MPLTLSLLLALSPLPQSCAPGTDRVSVDAAGLQSAGNSERPTLSLDGRVAAFATRGLLVPEKIQTSWSDVVLLDVATGQLELASRTPTGRGGNQVSFDPRLSADGRCVAFQSVATNLVPGDTNGKHDVFVYDRVTRQVERVSVDTGGAQGGENGSQPALSADGRFAAFTTRSGFAGQPPGPGQVYVRDRQAGTTSLVSVDSAGVPGDSHSGYPSLSADGRYVGFTSVASNLVPGDTNGLEDAFVHDRLTGVTVRASLSSAGAEPDGTCAYPELSADGRHLAFQSRATNLDPGDTTDSWDVYVRDLQAGTTWLASRTPAGTAGRYASRRPVPSADGRRVVFTSGADDLVAGDTNGQLDVFVADAVTGAVRRVSVTTGGVEGDDLSFEARPSGSGLEVVFTSRATNLVPGDTNAVYDVFLHRVGTDATVYGAGKVNSLGCAPAIAACGLSSASSSEGFTVSCANVRNQRPGLLLYATGGGSVPTPFQCGALLVGPAGIRRTPARFSGGSPAPAVDCSGRWSVDLNAFAAGLLGGAPHAALLVPGTTVEAQWWGRDSGFAAPCDSALSDALRFDVGA